VRGELQDVNYSEFNYSTARGIFFDGREAYIVEVYDGGTTDELGVKLYTEDEEMADTVLNQPSIHGIGINETLSMLDREAELPETDEEVEAFARYILQGETEKGLEYEGPRNPEDIEY